MILESMNTETVPGRISVEPYLEKGTRQLVVRMLIHVFSDRVDIAVKGLNQVRSSSQDYRTRFHE